jgi:hypothetical protein
VESCERDQVNIADADQERSTCTDVLEVLHFDVSVQEIVSA